MMLSVYVIVVYMSCAYSVSVHRVSLCTLRVRMIVFSECYFISYDNNTDISVSETLGQHTCT